MSFGKGFCVLDKSEAPVADMPNGGRHKDLPVGSVRVEIEATVLLGLLEGKRLCAADMRCLDCESKDCLWRLILAACARGMGRPA